MTGHKTIVSMNGEKREIHEYFYGLEVGPHGSETGGERKRTGWQRRMFSAQSMLQ